MEAFAVTLTNVTIGDLATRMHLAQTRRALTAVYAILVLEVTEFLVLIMMNVRLGITTVTRMPNVLTTGAPIIVVVKKASMEMAKSAKLLRQAVFNLVQVTSPF